MIRWVWDAYKSRSNAGKHGLSFETAQLVFDDPLALSRPDPFPGEERWQTIGMISTVIVLVVHTSPQALIGYEEEIGRIVSARKASAHERKAYEEEAF